MLLFIAELAGVAPSLRDFGKPISARNFGLIMTSLPTDRPSVLTLLHVSQLEMRHSNPVLKPGLIFRREIAWPTALPPAFLWQEIASPTAFAKKKKIIILKTTCTTKHKLNL